MKANHRKGITKSSTWYIKVSKHILHENHNFSSWDHSVLQKLGVDTGKVWLALYSQVNEAETDHY